MPQRYLDTWSHASEFSNIVDVIIPPDTLLPCQMPSNRVSYRPETSLILAVCSSALLRLENSYMRSHHKSLVERGEILSWVHGDGGAISFDLVCEALNIDAEILRAAIVKWCRDMERGKFRQVVVRRSVVRRSPAKGNSNQVRIRNTHPHYVRKADRRRASLEVRV